MYDDKTAGGFSASRRSKETARHVSSLRSRLLLLAVLSYNVGEYRLLGYGKQPKSRLVQKLESGDRDIRGEYISFCRYRGKELKALRLRRRVELALLYEK